MPSSIAWLDTSAEEQRRIREVLNLFAQSESRDELGIGQIRDTFSDLLFPGTSVLQTRARYLLVVPWLFTRGARRHSGPALKSWVEARERRLIDVMRREGHTEGLIGRVAGPNVKLLPSTIYWSGLSRYGILRRDVPQGRIGTTATEPDGAEELTERKLGDWHPTLPAPPAGFPDVLEGGFVLTPEEAVWLTERMRTAASGRLLEHVLTAARPVDPRSFAAWDDPSSSDAPGAVARALTHAELFSLAMHGAALLYNLLVGEQYEAAGLSRVVDPVDTSRTALEEWVVTCRIAEDRLTAWDREDFWQLVMTSNPRIGLSARAFVSAWLEAVVSGRASAAADDEDLRRLVRAREQTQKRAQARLTNPNLLKTWSGASGAGRLTYRWETVRRLVSDIQEARGRAVA